MTSVLLRAANPDDALAVANVHVRSWQSGYRDLLPRAYLDTLCAEERAQRYTFGRKDPHYPITIVAIDGDVICGFATIAPARDADATECGELCALYVDPDYWRHGVGKQLIRAARTMFSNHGFQRVHLWLLEGNTRGAHFYQNDGWVADGITRTENVWGIAIREVRYQRCLGIE